MSRFFYYQVEGGEESWHEAASTLREQIVKDLKPRFTTALDLDRLPTKEFKAEDYAEIRYWGDLYIDLDSASIDEAIADGHATLKKFEEMGVDLESLRYFASGSKGLHFEVPEGIYLAKAPPKGTPALPHIFRELVHDNLLVDTTDMRVYTAKRGRQWRTPNVDRGNGKFKVPLTLQELRDLTAEKYATLCSAPRFVPPPAPPKLTNAMMVEFTKAQDKVAAAAKTRKTSQRDEKLLKKFGGDVPPTLLALMNGDAIAEGKGFNQIAIQLGTAGHALGKTEEQFLSLCAGFINKHVGDGDRYSTPAKRRQALAQTYQYLQEDSCYSFSVGGIKSVLPKDYATPDFDSQGMEIEEDEVLEEELDQDITMGIRVNSKGIFKMDKERGMVQASAIGLTNPAMLRDLKTGECCGYECDVHVDRKPKGRFFFGMDTFLSRNKFLQMTLRVGSANMNATDPQVGAISDILRARVMQSGREVWATGREGIDVVTLPDSTVDIIWADMQEVTSRQGKSYALTGVHTKEATFKSDLRNAPMLEDSTEAREFFKNFFHINESEQLGKMFGFYVACFFTQMLRHTFNQFPQLQVFGIAGSGKSASNRLLSHLHYYKQQPVKQTFDTTPFVVENAVTSSASIPVIFDEFKPRETKADRVDKAKSVLRSNYDADQLNKGTVNKSSGESSTGIKSGVNAAPIVYIGEALESQTALVHRAIIVAFNPGLKKGKKAAFDHCMGHRQYLSMLGRTMTDKAMKVSLERLQTKILDCQNEVLKSIGEDLPEDADRQVYNAAVVLMGLDFAKMVMSQIFGDTYDCEFERMRDAIVGQGDAILHRVMSEPSKVLDTLSHLSQFEMDDKNHMRYGHDYLIDGGTIQIVMKEAYAKYVRYRRSLNEEVLFDNETAFLNAFINYAGTRDRQCFDSLLKKSITTTVYAFDLEYMATEKIGEFKPGNSN